MWDYIATFLAGVLTTLAFGFMGMLPGRQVYVDDDEDMEGNPDYEEISEEEALGEQPQGCCLRPRERPVLTSRKMAQMAKMGTSVYLVYTYDDQLKRYLLRPLVLPDQATKGLAYYCFQYSGTHKKWKCTRYGNDLNEFECSEELHYYLRHQSDLEAEMMENAGRSNFVDLTTERELLGHFAHHELKTSASPRQHDGNVGSSSIRVKDER